MTENVGIYLHEIQSRLYNHGNVVSVSTICRTLRRMGCTRQVIEVIALQRSDYCRAKFMAEVSCYDPSMLIWLDESGFDKRNSMRKRAYDIRGITPRDHQLLIRGMRYSAIPILSTEEIHDVCLFEGTVNGDKFLYFIRTLLRAVVQPFNWVNNHSIIIMDNASIHHVEQVTDYIENQLKARILFLPPYSPDLNPCEEVFSKVKSIVKENNILFQACQETRLFLTMAIGEVTMEDCNAYISHSGYQ